MAKVIFKYGTHAQYAALTSDQILDSALYFLTDTNELYRGTVPMCQSHVYAVTQNHEETELAAINRLFAESGIALLGDSVIVTDAEDSTLKYYYIYTGSEWYRVGANRPTVNAGDITFENGDTLEDILDALMSADDVTIEKNDDDELQLKDFGKQYYKYVTASGEEGQENYSAAHYELQVVDAQHPWVAGLEFRTTANGVGWYEQNTDSVDGLNSQVATLATEVGDLADIVAGLSGVFHFKGKLVLDSEKTIAENLATISSPEEGDVWQVGDDEYAYNVDNEWVQLGGNFDLSGYATISALTAVDNRVSTLESAAANYLTGISVNSVAQTVANGIANISIPTFDGSVAGIVPVAVLENVSSADLGKYFLNADGEWVQALDTRIGSLTLNGTQYSTVEGYVDAKIAASELIWEGLS